MKFRNTGNSEIQKYREKMKDRKIFKGSSGAGIANLKVKEMGRRRSWDRINLTQDDRRGFPGGSEFKVSAWNAGDPGSIPGSGRSPGEGNGNPLQYSFLENPMEGGAWQATVHGVAKSRTGLSDFTFTFQDDRNQVSKSILSKFIVAIQRTFVELLIEKHGDKQRLRLWDDSKSHQC